MTSRTNRKDPRRGTRLIPIVLVLGLLAGVVVLIGPLLNGTRSGGGALPWDAECRVETADGPVRLDREEAKLATTAVALAARGLQAPDTSGIDAAVMQRLAEGPPEDAGPSLACRGSAADGLEVQQPTATGLTPRAERLREAMTEVFGDLSLGGFAPGGIDYGHQEGSTHYDGRAIDVFFRPVTEENRREGWQLAHWLVAHGNDLHVQYVIFDDRVWSVHSSRGRWHDYHAADPDNPILRHLDHVHVDVLRGGSD